MKTNTRWMAIAVVGSLAAVTGAKALVLHGDLADYQTDFQQTPPAAGSVSASGGGSETLRVLTQDFGGFALLVERPIYQFDLSSLDQPLASAVFSVALLAVDTNVDYSVEVWGRSDNQPGPLFASEDGSAGQYASGAYQPAAAGSLADQNAPLGTVFLNITDYLNARYQEYAVGGDAWVYLRLQASYGFEVGSGVDASFTFASADHMNEAYRPRIETTPIPEPAHAVLLFGLAAIWFLWRRVRSVREQG